MKVLGFRKTRVEGFLDFDLDVNGEKIPFTYNPDDSEETTQFITKWLADNPDAVPDEYVAPVLNPSHFVLTPVQLRRMIARNAAGGTKNVSQTIQNMEDSPHQDDLHSYWEYETSFTWDNPLTQEILKIAFPEPNIAEGFWILAATGEL